MENKTQYISLQEATKYCNYSQEYLSLRARQGKLKAIKIGRNWATKKEWIDEYLKAFKLVKEEFGKVEGVSEPKKTEPPENLPVETETIRYLAPLVGEPIPRIRLRFITALIFVLLISGTFYLWQAQPEISFEKMKNTYQDTTTAIVSMDFKEARASTIETFKEYGQWLKLQIPKVKESYFAADDFIEEKLVQGYQVITRPFRLVISPQEKLGVKEEPGVLETTKEGMVVIPSTEKDEELKTKIKEAFSDEVKVEPKDETSGIIVPVFKEGEGEEYLYIMVPVKN